MGNPMNQSFECQDWRGLNNLGTIPQGESRNNSIRQHELWISLRTLPAQLEDAVITDL